MNNFQGDQPQERYVYREYPRLMYNHDSGETLSVSSDSDKEKAIAEGWKIEPPKPKPAPKPSVLSAAQFSELDERIAELEAWRAEAQGLLEEVAKRKKN